jgi:hypothetical protein
VVAPSGGRVAGVTAAEAGCTAVLTEDLAEGTTLAGVCTIKPFAGAVLSAAAEALLSVA